MSRSKKLRLVWDFVQKRGRLRRNRVEGSCSITYLVCRRGNCDEDARETQRKGIGFTKEGNCFTEVSDAAGLAKVADTMSATSAVGRLVQVCERWIYSACLCFALTREEQQRSGFRYDYSVCQGEYSRN